MMLVQFEAMKKLHSILEREKEIQEAQSLVSILCVALEQYANEPKDIDVNSVLDMVRVIDKKLVRAGEFKN